MGSSIVIPNLSSLGPRRRSAAGPEAGDEPLMGFLGFVLGDEEYGIDLSLVKQIVKPPPVTWVPRVRPHILGIISIRGNVVTLVDTRLLMGLPVSEHPKSGRVLLIDFHDERVGLLVDAVTQVRRVGASLFEESPDLQDSTMAEKVVGIIRPDEMTQVIIIDLAEILEESMR